MVELYHFWSSVCSVRCRMALEEKGVAWTSRYTDIFRFDHLRPEYLADGGGVPDDSHDDVSSVSHQEGRCRDFVLGKGGRRQDRGEECSSGQHKTRDTPITEQHGFSPTV